MEGESGEAPALEKWIIRITLGFFWQASANLLGTSMLMYSKSERVFKLRLGPNRFTTTLEFYIVQSIMFESSKSIFFNSTDCPVTAHSFSSFNSSL